MKDALRADAAILVEGASAASGERLSSVAASAAAALADEVSSRNKRLEKLAAEISALGSKGSATTEALRENEKRLAELREEVLSAPNYGAQVEALEQQQNAAREIQDSLEAKMAAASREIHDLHSTGYCKQDALEALRDDLSAKVDGCVDGVAVLNGQVDDMRDSLGVTPSLDQVEQMITGAIDRAAKALRPPNDTSMAAAVGVRCIGCNRVGAGFHGQMAGNVAHDKFGGIATAAPDTQKVYREQWGVMLAVQDRANAAAEKKWLEAKSKYDSTRASAPPASFGHQATKRGGGLKPLRAAPPAAARRRSPALKDSPGLSGAEANNDLAPWGE
jgi:predicted  nucleic acid-binding Zn-ribbon protein